MQLNFPKSLIPGLLKFINIVGPIAGFTAALSPLVPFYINKYYPSNSSFTPVTKNQIVYVLVEQEIENK